VVSASLLDVNVLIASAYEWHVGHDRAHAWWRQSGGQPWATCALTQAGFVRVIANRQFHEQRVSVAQAFELLKAMMERPGHHFWPIDITLPEAVQPFQKSLVGHRQVTDAYLLGLAIKNKGRLITLDRGIEVLAGESCRQHVTVLES
jgi:uncharacterized protein